MNNMTFKNCFTSVLSAIFLVFYLFHAPIVPHLDNYPVLEQSHHQELVDIEHLNYINENKYEWVYDRKTGLLIQI